MNYGIQHPAVGVARKFDYRLFAPVLVAGIVFLLDMRTPNGLIDGVLYIVVVLLCWWLPNPRAAPWAALALMPVMLLGFKLSPLGAPLWIAVVNRLVAAGAVWLTACFIWFVRSSRIAEAHLEVRLENSDRSQISQWLREDIELELQTLEWRVIRVQYRAPKGSGINDEAFMLRQQIRRIRGSVFEKMWSLTDQSVDNPHL